MTTTNLHENFYQVFSNYFDSKASRAMEIEKEDPIISLIDGFSLQLDKTLST